MHSVWSLIIRRYLRFAERHAGLVLLTCVLLALGGMGLAQRLSVNPRLDALLPADSPALPAIEELGRRVPSSSPLYLLVTSDDPELNRQLAGELRDGAQAWPETIYALDRRDPSYFLERRLLFLPAEDLKQLAYQIEDIVDYEECAAVPGCVNLDDRPDDPDEQALRDKIAKIPEVKNLLSLFGLQELPADSAGQRGAQHDSNQAEQDQDAREPRLGELCSEDGRVCAVTVFIDGSPSNLAFAEHIDGRAEALFAKVRPATAPASLRMTTSGAYRNAPLTKKAVGRDLSLTASLSTGLILLLVMAQFRGIRPLLLIFIPIAAASLWTLGLIGLIHPELNIISAFTLAVLAGLGIDFGEHILTHYGTERSHGVEVPDALMSTYETLGGPMGVACLTSGCGFGALMAADFRGFAEMGGMAALGVALALVAFLVMLPALVHIFHRIVPEKGGFIRKFTRSFGLRVQRPARVARFLVYGGLLLTAGATYVGSHVSFEYNFRNLQAKAVGHGISYGEALHGTTRSAVVMLADSSHALEKTAQTLRAEHPEKVQAEQTWLLTPASFVPPEQEARLIAIQLLRTAVERAEHRLSEEDRASLAYIQPLLGVKSPITPEGLPRWVREWLTDTDGKFGTFGLMYNDLSGSDAHAMEGLANELHSLSARFPAVRFASPEALLGLVIPGLRHDAPRMLGWALLGLFISALVISRSLVKTLTMLLPLALAAGLSLALMVVFGIKVNMYNMLVFPLSFGIGIDGAVYVVWVMSRYDGATTPAQFAVTARGVLGSTITTAAGFGAMVVASNPGLVSLGQLALITLSCSLLVNLLWLPALMYLRHGPSDAPPRGLQLSQDSEIRTP